MGPSRPAARGGGDPGPQASYRRRRPELAAGRSQSPQLTADAGPRGEGRLTDASRGGRAADPAAPAPRTPPRSPAIAPHPHGAPAARARPLGAARRPVPVSDHVPAAAARPRRLRDSEQPSPARPAHALSRGPHQPRATNGELRPARRAPPRRQRAANGARDRPRQDRAPPLRLRPMVVTHRPSARTWRRSGTAPRGVLLAPPRGARLVARWHRRQSLRVMGKTVQDV